MPLIWRIFCPKTSVCLFRNICFGFGRWLIIKKLFKQQAWLLRLKYRFIIYKIIQDQLSRKFWRYFTKIESTVTSFPCFILMKIPMKKPEVLLANRLAREYRANNCKCRMFIILKRWVSLEITSYLWNGRLSELIKWFVYLLRFKKSF